MTTKPQTREFEMVPKFLVRAMFGLILGTLALVSYQAISDRSHAGVLTVAPEAASSLIRMEGTREGAVTVYNAGGDVIARSGEDKQGFIGVIWRVLARERALAGVADTPGDTPPVRVLRRTNGNISVEDTVTDWSVDLIGYGKDNIAAFARLVD
ncbi:photosynthetic complex assembly protein [Roseovarius sp. LXJ103]|uniref:photosynthetic complex assembly protein PuhC n=1 Tax=Roseovarius carneus TaxID=2853164 RepID=UPI000D613FF7|nr:photosynthetic complex assembly protein PuhC [Roseovarius carneus]MBZ8119153.1 photosynthetic complex assembly protein [Roseovarius carneus]PWE35214.1 photosynthetic complex assembly protein [Pelagicola sp. LXJ1103]